MFHLKNYFIWILAPKLETSDSTIDYYYDFSQSIQEYEQVFTQLRLPYKWLNVTTKNYATLIDEAIVENTSINVSPIFFNLCDGDHTNNVPGIEVIHYLQLTNQIFTGADAYFYKISTSKAAMKCAFDDNKVTNAPWLLIHTIEDIQETIFKKIAPPIFVKPNVSAGSMGVGINNVVHNYSELLSVSNQLFKGYNGWNLNEDGLLIEQFINGSEFTVFIIGNYTHYETATILMPVERVFHKSLPSEEQFLSFDRLWEIYENETPMPNNENFYEYALPKTALIGALKQISWDAFYACQGIGYARVDIRMDKNTNRLFVLEVNAQCGISEDENYTSIGAIIKASNTTFATVVQQIIEVAILTKTT